MILDCHNNSCPDQFRGTCGRQITNEFRCNEQTNRSGGAIDPTAPYSLRTKVVKEPGIWNTSK